MEPRIQYAKTADGVSIAFWTLGEGMPLVHMPPMPYGHIQMEWQISEYRRWFERLGEERKLIRYGNRGSGLSERDVTDYSLDAHVRDLEAVVGRLDLQSFALLGLYHSGPVAIAYAARHPNRVSHLLLWHSWARTLDTASPQLRGLRRLLEVDWELYTETVAHELWGWSEGEPARRYAALIREGVAHAAAQAFFAATRESDVSALLAQVRSPTLVLHRRLTSLPEVMSRGPLLPAYRTRAWPFSKGHRGPPFWGTGDPCFRPSTSSWAKVRGPQPRRPPPSGLVTVLFTDIEGSTALTQRLGDAGAQEVVRAHNTIVRDALKACGGTDIKHTGDGIMASFPTATKALECAVAIQRAVAEWNAGVGAQGLAPLHVRIGLNAGEPVAEEEDLFGTAVQLARRICDRAEAGQVLVSDVVRQLAAGKGFLFSDVGDVVLKGFEDPVRLYELGWEG